MSDKARIYAVIPVFHPQRSDLAAITATIPPGELVAVINDSGSYKQLDPAHLIRPGKNLGFGGGVNRGINLAFMLGAEWVVAINQDLQLTPRSWKQLKGKLTDLPPGIYGPAAGFFEPRRMTATLTAESNQADYISGSCMAIHRDVISEIGGFYEPFFMYYEDADYCVRAKKAGFPVAKLEFSGIIHTGHPALGLGSSLHEYYLARNHWIFMSRQAPFPVRIRETFRLPFTLLKHLTNRNVHAFLGILDGLRGIGGRRGSV